MGLSSIMRIDILTIFPNMFRGPFDESIVKRAVDSGLVSIHLHDVREWAPDRHKTVDDYPYGGGPGMVMKPDVLFAATEGVLDQAPQREPVVLLTPIGRRLTDAVVAELAAMVLVDAVVRRIPGALGSPQSAAEESFAAGLLEAPHYTRPPEFRGWAVPDVLTSGDHQEVARWRRRQNLLLTARRRPDLLAAAELTPEEREWLALQLGEQ